MARTLIDMPQAARRGDVIEIRVTIGHPMETGYGSGADGTRLPRNIIQRFSCKIGDELVFAAELFPAISANPYLAFHAAVFSSATVELRWEGDNGFVHTERRPLTVT